MRPRWRLSVLLTAIAALGASLAPLVARRDSLALRAEYHATQALCYGEASQADSQGADRVEGKTPSPLRNFLDPSSVVPLRVSSSLNAARSAYHAALRDKYERAARYPWLPLAPDPPPPP
jgi:hypothetical protein